MKTKTSELTGAALDWAVAKCEGLKIANLLADGIVWLVDSQGYISRNFNPSSNWIWGGPIIEREKICVVATPSAHWDARITEYPPIYHAGSTPLIASMRCYVASKLGDTLDIPEELTK